MKNSDTIKSSLEKAHDFYGRYYTGRSRFKRLLNYPIKTIKRIIAQRIGWKGSIPVVTRTCFGEKIFVLLPDKNAGSLYYFGFLPKQEYPLSLYLTKTLKKNDIFYDVGANYGFYSVLAKTLIKEGEIHVFEPHPLLSRCLRKSLDNEACVNEVALSDKTGEATFYDKHVVGHSGGSTIVGEVMKLSNKNHNILKVATITLDEYIKTHTPPSVIKIDVEGAEKLVLEGGKKAIEKYRPKVIIEVWGGNLWEKYSRPAVDFLFQCGYVANEIGPDGDLVSISKSDLINRSSHIKYDNLVFS